VSDGEEMLHFINQLDSDKDDPCPDLLLLDLGLPKYSGREILQHLRASKKCSQVPVVVMTSSDWRKDLELAEKHERVHYFRKPSTLEEFMHLGGLVKNMIERVAK
jgi:CheY-like chemotaxis protein